MSIDTTPPDLKVIKESVELKQGVSYTRQDVLRNIDFDEGEIEYQSDIDEQFPGTYRVYVTATDESGNRSEISYEVFIKDSEAPTVLNYGDGAMILRGEDFDISDIISYGDDYDPKPKIEVEGNFVKKPIVTIEMEDGGIIKLELYPSKAPETVNNFVSLINKGFYDGLIFHRTIPGFMAQGGDPEGTGMGGPGYGIKGEFKDNGVENTISHLRGIVSMARSSMPNSAGSQFFIVTDDSTFLDGQYAAFGSVLEGMDVVDKIVKSRVITRSPFGGGKDRPVEPPVMKKVTVETFGVEYPEPNKI